jgi:hypothetical protein
VERLHAPLPLVRHLGIGNGVYPPPDGSFVEVVFADPGRIQQTAHMADLVLALLKRTDPATNEGPEQIIRDQTLLQKTPQSVIHDLKLRESVSRIVSEVQFGYWRLNPELGQVKGIVALSALHVEKSPLPLLDGV